jgi:hypothetical protein
VSDLVIRWFYRVRSGAIPPPNCGRPGPGYFLHVVKHAAATLELGEHEKNSIQEQKTTHGYLEPRLGFVKGGYNGYCRNRTFEQEVETDGQGSLT